MYIYFGPFRRLRHAFFLQRAFAIYTCRIMSKFDKLVNCRLNFFLHMWICNLPNELKNPANCALCEETESSLKCLCLSFSYTIRITQSCIQAHTSTRLHVRIYNLKLICLVSFEHDCPQQVQWPLSYQSWYLLVGHVFYDNYRSIIIMKNIDNFRILKLSVCYVLFVVYSIPVNKVNSLILTLQVNFLKYQSQII